MAEENTSNAMYYSVDKLRALSEELIAEAGNFSKVIEAMYNDIYGMETNNYWKGATYDQFKTMCDDFKNKEINTIITKLKSWGKGFDDIATSASETTANNVKIFEDGI